MKGQIMKTAKIGIFALLAFFAVFSAAAARADLYFENENVTRGVARQKDGTTIQKNYFSSTAMRVEPGDGKIIIVDYDSMTMCSLDPGSKTYSELNLNDIPGLPPGASAADREKMMQFMGGLEMRVTPTDETKVIEGYQCRKYLLNMMMLRGVYWVSKDVKGYRELRALGTRMMSISEKNPMFRQMNVAGMIDKLDGFPVRTENSLMGGTVVSTLKRVEQKDLDPALFKVPKDYVLKSSRN
jgi:hypothetical protein